MYLYLRESPRALILTAGEDNPNAKALIFSSTPEGARTGRATVGFMSSSEFNLTGMLKLTPRPVKGCLGLIQFASNDLFLAVVTSASELGNIYPSAQSPHNVCRIHEVAFYSLITSAFDDLSTVSDGTVNDSQEHLNGASPYEHPCAPITKILSSGTFYYTPYPHWDISSRLSERILKKRVDNHDLGDFDNRFVWNEYVIRSLLDFRERLDVEERQEFDRSQFIFASFSPFAASGLFRTTLRNTISPSIHGTLGMISRLGWRRAGTRFNTRGIDDDGNCANFVEVGTIDLTAWVYYIKPTVQTEVTFIMSKLEAAYRVRASLKAFCPQLTQMIVFWEQQGFQTFGQKIQITRPQAASQPAFDRHFAHLVDEYSATHAVNLLGTKENESILTLAYAQHLRSGRAEGGEIIGFSHFDFHTSARSVGHDNIPRELNRIDGLHSDLNRYGWTPSFSGDALSRIYAGTGALNTSFTRTGKRTLAGVLSDATKSVSRAYINNFQDKAKQAAIDMLLPPSESLLPWLFPIDSTYEPDIFALGFQEIVPLTAQQIIQTDPEKKRMWENAIIETLAKRPNKNAEYVLLRSDQLVGTALIVIVKSNILKYIRNVEGATKKTGLRGMSGNKGAVGIRLDYHDTTFCFLTAHLAAGQSNVEERNNDYNTIVNGLNFLRGKTINGHE
ncbi:hypothetical protein Clacol_001492 [Clathrus columnatus]|uniref:phosphoinositide 5-phosphatase n=1 Tax=Clathrus columnatus TaxID=1419009 RepID=A0AAV4ZYD3_9AGAM|nr:hypothetical protein Clacol_001492 [Clathrus columnatus]